MLTKNQISFLMNRALDGDRIILETRIDGVHKKRIFWKGLGNRSGLHSFASELLSREYQKGKARLEKKLRTADEGVLKVFEYRNITRDRGTWDQVKRIHLG